MEESSLQKYKSLFEEFGANLESIRTGMVSFYCKVCGTHNEITYDAAVTNRLKFRLTPCRVCKPLKEGYSAAELGLFEFVKSLAPDAVQGDRSVLGGKELDIYVPSAGVAIEYDGVFCHSDKFKSKAYHAEKTEACRAKGICLLHIYSDELETDEAFCKHKIRESLSKAVVIHKDECSLKTLKTEAEFAEFSEFIKENSLSGISVHFDSAYTLYTGKEIIAGIGLSESLRETNLTTYVSKLGYVVPGFLRDGLLAHGIKTGVSAVLDNRWITPFMISEFTDVEFKAPVYSEPSFEYTDGFVRYQTEVVGDESKYDKIYNCGYAEFRL